VRPAPAATASPATALAIAVLLALTSLADAAPVPANGKAARAFAEIERMHVYWGQGIGISGSDEGKTYVQLWSILESTEVDAYLVRLSKSQNVVSRMAAAVGFGIHRSDKGRTILTTLLKDGGRAEAYEHGCVGDMRTVAEFARGALALYP
jgi:hypothetical protein